MDIFLVAAQEILLGPVIGWVAAIVENYILQQIYNDSLAEITITLSFTYMTFHLGETVRFLFIAPSFFFFLIVYFFSIVISFFP